MTKHKPIPIGFATHEAAAKAVVRWRLEEERLGPPNDDGGSIWPPPPQNGNGE